MRKRRMAGAKPADDHRQTAGLRFEGQRSANATMATVGGMNRDSGKDARRRREKRVTTTGRWSGVDGRDERRQIEGRAGLNIFKGAKKLTESHGGFRKSVYVCSRKTRAGGRHCFCRCIGGAAIVAFPHKAPARRGCGRRGRKTRIMNSTTRKLCKRKICMK